MKILFLVLMMALSACAAPTPSSTWVLYSWANSGRYVPSATDGSFSFPLAKKSSAYPAFLTTTLDSSVLGDLTGQTITATINLTVTGSPLFRFGGQGSWNNGSLPPNTRLYFSTNAAAYDLQDATLHENAYWWSGSAWTEVTNNMGIVVLSDTFDPVHWSNAQGHSAADPAYTPAFNAAVANVRQIGLAFSGGSFFDTGVAVIANTGTATFHLLNYQAQ